MKELTDLEICKRIAEIESKTIDCESLGNVYIVNSAVGESTVYNPLTNDALCFQLMIKYEINISTYYKIDDLEAWYGAEIDLEEIEARTPNYAVCLAIIESQS